MNDIYHLFCKKGNLSALECLEITEFPGRNAICIVHISLIDNVFRTERIACFLFKLFQNIRAYRCRISVPVHIFFSCHLVKDQRKLVEKCCKTYYIHILMGFQETTETFHRILSCGRLAHVKGHLRLHILPVIDNCIVHMNRIPHNIRKKAYSILMKRHCLDLYISGFFIIRPLFTGNRLACSTIHNLPPFADIISCIYCKHIRVKMIHQMNFQRFLHCCVDGCHNIHLLDFFRMSFCPVVILTCCVIGCIDLGSCILQFLWKLCSVTVTDGICAPLFHNIKCLSDHVQICRNRDSSSFFCHVHTSI